MATNPSGLVVDENGPINRQIFTESEIHREEPSRILARCWLSLCCKDAGN